MKLFEQIRKKCEDNLIAWARKTEEERALEQQAKEEERLKQEQARQAEIARKQKEFPKQARQEQIKVESAKTAQDERVQKILASKVPVDYIIELTTMYTKTLCGKEFTYPRDDYFICDAPREHLVPPYSKYKFIKITGENIGEVFTSISDDELQLVDSKGHIYSKNNIIYLVLLDQYSKYTIDKLNDITEETNQKYTAAWTDSIKSEAKSKQLKDDIFNL